MRTVLLNDDGLVVNAIVPPEDLATYEPPEGLTLAQVEDLCVGPGWMLVDGEWTAPAGGTETGGQPTLAELQAQLAAIQAQIEQLLAQQPTED